MALQITADHVANIAAFLAIVCYSAWPLFRTRRSMLLAQLTALGWLTVHYTAAEASTAAMVNFLGAIQIAACLLFGTRPRLRWIGYGLAACMIGASFATWHGMTSALATIGMVLVAIGRAQVNAHTMRLLVLAGGPFWLAHDLMIGSPIAIADAVSLAIGLWTTGQRSTDTPRLPSPTVGVGPKRQGGSA